MKRFQRFYSARGNLRILCIVFLMLPLVSFAQITLNIKNQPIRSILKEIEQQASYKLFYSEDLKGLEKLNSVNVKNATLGQTMKQVLAGTELDYQIKNDVITIIPKNNVEERGDVKKITGVVLDAIGEPIIGANVSVKGTTNGTITDIDGKFILEVAQGQTLLVSYIGYTSQELKVTLQGNYSIAMNEDLQALDEIVVVGYGTQKRVNLTGAVDLVTSEVLENRPITNISQGLVGAVPNLNIKMRNGKPTESPSYNVRGTTSIGQGGSALILIDGVEGDPKMLNPNDIESISVLKDAASASIYGARAAYGVVLITTKNATKGKTSITYSGNVSSKSPTMLPNNNNESYPWAAGFNEAWSKWNDVGSYPTAINKTMSFSQEYLAELKRRWEDPSLPKVEVDPRTGEYIYYGSTDWYKEMYKPSFFAQDHNLSISGGNDLATFYVSGRYNKEDGLFKYNPDTYDMYNIRAKGTLQVTKRFSIENNAEYSSMKFRDPTNCVGENVDIWRCIAAEGHPLAPLLNPDGSISFPAAYTVGDLYYGKNYLDTRQRVFKNKIGGKLELLEDNSLVVRADFTYQSTDNSSLQTRVPVPYSRYEGVTAYVGSNRNNLTQRSYTTEYMAANIYANYSKTINQAHNFNFLAGYNYESSLYKNMTTQRDGLVFEDAADMNLALGQTMSISGGHTRWAIAGGFFRVNYNLKERYLLEVNGRYDGSSKFPSNQQWGFFPSASLGWRVSEESFWKINPKAFSDMKVRLSVGSLGNGNITPYSFSEQFSISQSGRILNGVRPQSTAQPTIVPDGLTWETSTTANIGLDFATLNNRLHFNGDFYRRWTSNMFTFGPTVPAIFGAAVPKGNYADMYTQGWEISVNWADQFQVAGKTFNYDLRFILSDYIAEITKYYNPDMNLSDYYVGQRVGEIWGYRVDGLFRSAEEIANSPSQVNIPATNTKKNYPGDLKFKNLDGDNVIWKGQDCVGDSGDKTIIGNSEPRYAFGINLNGDWNGFFVSAFFQGVIKQDYYPRPDSRFWGQYSRPYNDLPAWHEGNYFKEELQNFDAYLPRYKGYVAQGAGRELTTINDRYLQNAAYIRLRNLQLGYTLPQSLSSKLSMNSIKVYVSGENLFSLSPYYKYQRDTDVTSIYGSDTSTTIGDGYNYPMLKSFSLGLTLNF